VRPGFLPSVSHVTSQLSGQLALPRLFDFAAQLTGRLAASEEVLQL
jgi:hypothetical protein